jgi:beta-fructofuranosidase
MIFLKQADVEIDFALTSLDSAAEPFDPSWLLDIEKHCREADASVRGGVGPFGLVVLASDDMEEHTSVHFRVYKSQEKYMVLMCSDLRKLVPSFIFSFSRNLSCTLLLFVKKKT